MKHVRRVKPPLPFEHTTAKRPLTVEELATSWVDDEGMISAEEGADRVFRAACVIGDFTVSLNHGRGRFTTKRYRTYPEALVVALALIREGKDPAIRAATKNRDALLDGAAHRDKVNAWVSKEEARRVVWQRYLDMYGEVTGQRLRCPALDELSPRRRTPRAKINKGVKR